MLVVIALVLAAGWACSSLLVGNRVFDLEVYLSGGRAVRNGVDLYGPQVGVDTFGFTYPPFAALLFSALTFLPVGGGVLIVAAASLGALAVIISLSDPALAHRALTGRPGIALLVVVIMVTCQPVRSTMLNGQVNLVLAAMVMLDLLTPRTGRLRGVLVGIAAAVKLTPAIFVIYLLARRRVRDAAVAAGTFVVITGTTWLLLPRDSAKFWTSAVLGNERIGDTAEPSNQSIMGYALRLVGGDAARSLWAVLVLPVAGIGLALAVRASCVGQEPLALAMVGLTGCLISPVSWWHHWVWFIPWLAAVCVSARTRAERFALGVFAVWIVGVSYIHEPVLASWGPTRLLQDNSHLLILGVAMAFFLTRLRSSRSGLGRRTVPPGRPTMGAQPPAWSTPHGGPTSRRRSRLSARPR